MATRSAVNQKVQMGFESVHGTAVACNKLLNAFTWTLGTQPSTKQFMGTGRQYISASAYLYTEGSVKVTGPGDFGQLTYLFAMLWGAPTTALDGASSTVYNNTWTPPLTGSYAASVKSATIQMGDAVDAEQYAFNVLKELGYKFTRKQEMTIDGTGINQSFTDGASLTASPTEVEQIPMTGAQMNVYLDATSGGIGGTLITSDLLEFEYKASEYFAGYYPVNRANSSYVDLVDKAKKHEVTLKLQATSASIGYIATYLNTGTKLYLRVDGLGPIIDAGHSLAAEFQHDMCCVVSKVDPFEDTDGVYALKYTLQIAEDTAWNTGQAQKITLTNLLNGLS